MEDLTWVSATHGWALTTSPGCGQPTCTDVLTTTNGGTTWSQVGSIAATSSQCTGCSTLGVTHIRFANDLDGYAFDPDLFVTTDGGQTWSQETGPYIAALEPAGSNVMRIAYTHDGCPGPCDLLIQVAPAGSDIWNSEVSPFIGDSVQLVRQGVDDAYVAVFENSAGGDQSAHATLMISLDGGSSWSNRPDPCGAPAGDEFDTTAIAAAPDSVLAVLCNERGEGQHSFVAVSTDGGADFTQRPFLADNDTFEKAIAVTSATQLFVSSGASAGSGSSRWILLGSTDGGISWHQEIDETGQLQPGFPAQGFLGFETSSVGRWVGYPYHLWETTDGGSTWVRQAVNP
jgi:photosystem II stability/assembly factor-like uncharacterized protein